MRERLEDTDFRVSLRCVGECCDADGCFRCAASHYTCHGQGIVALSGHTCPYFLILLTRCRGIGGSSDLRPVSVTLWRGSNSEASGRQRRSGVRIRARLSEAAPDIPQSGIRPPLRNVSDRTSVRWRRRERAIQRNARVCLVADALLCLGLR